MKATLFYADEKVSNAYNTLKMSSKTSEQELLVLLEHAFNALSELYQILTRFFYFTEPRLLLR
ncbi:hypothetical protein RJ53_08790 [Methanocalculus chunghsingensis]|uniref:Uncharacterized protein n=1 Tax=Methanocalculus chunghsingensis TaxID=156457 RepID=A0A8J7W8S3_9EURY|nr:hypothetical protein [Methanocalculus chunghsingensis]